MDADRTSDPVLDRTVGVGDRSHGRTLPGVRPGAPKRNLLVVLFYLLVLTVIAGTVLRLW